MPDVKNFTDPLSGWEPIEYVVGEVRKFLRRDCSLRKEDGYSGGFQGKVKIELDCFAVRTVHIEMEVPITLPSEVKRSLDSLPPEQVEKSEIIETIVIPREENLDAVRAHIKANNEEVTEEAEPTEEADTSTRGRRKYARKALAGVGAVGE